MFCLKEAPFAKCSCPNSQSQNKLLVAGGELHPYLKDYRSVAELESALTSWFRFYNHERLHQSLKYRTPAEVYQQAGKDSESIDEGRDHN